MPFPPRLTIDASSLDNCRGLSDHCIHEKQTTSSLMQGCPALQKSCTVCCILVQSSAVHFHSQFSVNGVTKNTSERITDPSTLRTAVVWVSFLQQLPQQMPEMSRCPNGTESFHNKTGVRREEQAYIRLSPPAPEPTLFFFPSINTQPRAPETSR